ncbi:MAG: hypothetical protein KDD47_27500 [Acidobacteria bacterium]|nr:hypothetical protein [Acidobacteriota bacterium]
MQLFLPTTLPVEVRFKAEISKLRRSPEELYQALADLMNGRLASLVLTANRTRILSCRPAGAGARGLDLRLHGCFLEADHPTLEAVAGYSLGILPQRRRRHALEVLRRHFDAHQALLREPTRPRNPPRVQLRSRGRVVDLAALFEALNQEFFAGRIEAAITWGKSLPKRPPRSADRRTLRLGSYDGRRKLIRIHRALDDPKVPAAVIETVIYHEMLHADLPPVVAGGRRRFHTPEFRRRERLHPSFAFTELWLEEHLPYLLSARYRPC